MEYFTVIFRFTGLALALLAIIYLTLFKEKRTTTILFGLFFITYIGPIFHQIVTHSHLWTTYPRLFYLPINFFFFTMPIFYLYVKSFFEEIETKEVVLLAIPGILEFLFMFTMFCLPTDISVAFAQGNKMFFPLLFGFLLPIFSLVFIVLTLRKVYLYHKKYLDFFSNTQKVNLQWIKYTCIILTANYIFMFSPLILQDIWMELIDSLLTLLCIYWVSIYGIKQSHIPSEFQVFESNKTNPTVDSGDFNRIKKALDVDKVFTNPNLTVVDLSELVGLHPKKVSQAINHYADMNFNQLINKYRIDESKRLLSDENYHNLTIEAIGKEAGFNSRSVFNQVFKSLVGQTPKDYKSQVTQ